LISKFKDHIQRKFSFLKGEKLLVACSGGIDSMVLTDLLFKLDYQIELAHCNFHLRGKESDLDEKFVIDTAKDLQIPIHTISFDTKNYAAKNNISIQMAARNLRYTWFENLLREKKLNYLLTAHHADDNLETFLINFSRGTGLEGLTGIPEVNGKSIRTLLPFSRKEIEQYAKENNITWREDQSNKENKYLRNKLRHDIIPLLKELNPSFLNSFNKTVGHLQGSNQILKDRIEELKKEIQIIDGEDLKFKIQHLKLLNIPKAYLFELLKQYGFTEWGSILDLLNAESGKQMISKTHRLLKDRDYLIVSPLNLRNKQSEQYAINESTTNLKIDNSPDNSNDINLSFQQLNPEKINLASIKKTDLNTVFIDKNMLKFPLFVRKWNNGDYFYPIGLKGRKKLSKYFKDEKMSLIEKECIWLLCSENKIVWIIGKRPDDRFKITDETKNILKITTKT
jgi:tRNA(Ile)-lysidine synthase